MVITHVIQLLVEMARSRIRKSKASNDIKQTPLRTTAAGSAIGEIDLPMGKQLTRMSDRYGKCDCYGRL